MLPGLQVTVVQSLLILQTLSYLCRQHFREFLADFFQGFSFSTFWYLLFNTLDFGILIIINKYYFSIVWWVSRVGKCLLRADLAYSLSHWELIQTRYEFQFWQRRLSVLDERPPLLPGATWLLVLNPLFKMSASPGFIAWMTVDDSSFSSLSSAVNCIVYSLLQRIQKMKKNLLDISELLYWFCLETVVHGLILTGGLRSRKCPGSRASGSSHGDGKGQSNWSGVFNSFNFTEDFAWDESKLNLKSLIVRFIWYFTLITPVYQIPPKCVARVGIKCRWICSWTKKWWMVFWFVDKSSWACFISGLAR